MTLRIAQLANFVGPVSGGMRRAIDQLGAGYIAAGCERILVVPGERDTWQETDQGIVVEVASPRLPNSAYRMIAQPWRALDAVARFEPTSVEVSDKWTLSPAARWARKRRIGSVLFSHERLDGMLSGWMRRRFGVETAVGALNRRLAQAFDAVVVTSQYAADEFANTSAHLVHVPLGVDLETFHPRVGRPLDDGVWKLVHVGRLSHEKSPQLAIATAVELWRRGHPVQMKVFGTGPDLEEMQRVAGDAPVSFEGYLDGRDAVARAFASADVSLSVCPVETFGLAVLEALATGTPVVTAAFGGARELVDDTCGAWGMPDAASLADAVERVWAQPQHRMRAAARERAEKYTWQASIDAMVELHRSLAGPRRRGGTR